MKSVIYTTLFLLLLLGLFIVNKGFKHQDEQNLELFYDISVDTSKTLAKANEVLNRSENLEEDFEDVYDNNSSLLHINKELKKENSLLKDSVQNMSNELKVIKLRLKEPKRKNIIQKVFNIAPDSVETIVLDTIQ
jgi:hypothetical protein